MASTLVGSPSCTLDFHFEPLTEFLDLRSHVWGLRMSPSGFNFMAYDLLDIHLGQNKTYINFQRTVKVSKSSLLRTDA